MLLVSDPDFDLHVGDVRDVLRELEPESVHCVVTSPPYWGLRDYGTGEWEGGDAECDHRAPSRFDYDVSDKQHSNSASEQHSVFKDICGKCGAHRVDKQLGLEPTPEGYVASMVEVFRGVRRVLRADGTCWLNLGDSYNSIGGTVGGGKNIEERKPTLRGFAGLKPKDLVGIPWRVAFALQADGWYLRSDIIWSKPNPMPESVTDRPTKAHEYLFLLTKSPRYYYDAEAIREPHKEPWRSNGKSEQNNWSVGGTEESRGSHATVREYNPAGRNIRSVWEIATQPFTARGLFGDEGRIVSPDCPVHGDLRRQQTTASDDGRADAPSSHTPSTDADPVQAPPDEPVPIDPTLAQDSALDSSDSPALGRGDAATLHSNESRRTGLVLETSLPYSASVQSYDHTGDTSESPESGALFDHIPESRSEQDERVDLLSAQTAARNARKSSCTCKYIDHFATFPQALVEPCIKAGTSERGCCPECGAPWVRVVERGDSTWVERKANGAPMRSGYSQAGGGNVGAAPAQTLGWRPSCTCVVYHSDTGPYSPYSPAPCVVLDPFLGSGTTALVARRLGRKCIGVELSPEYAALAAKRLQQLSLLAEGAA